MNMKRQNDPPKKAETSPETASAQGSFNQTETNILTYLSVHPTTARLPLQSYITKILKNATKNSKGSNLERALAQGSSAQLRLALADGREDREELKDADIFQGSIRKNNDSFTAILDVHSTTAQILVLVRTHKSQQYSAPSSCKVS